MLSLRVIRDPAHVQHYFSIDDLTVESRLSSHWEGQWARLWHLTSPVDPTLFREILEGRLPQGRSCPKGISVYGVDATFSAPKSVSIAALVWGDRRLIDSHDQAVREALSWIESEHCYFWRRTGGQAVAVAGSGILAATFRHGLSRLADPQLHTHSVIVNFTAAPDGSFRAIDRSFLFNAATLLGGYYRLELAARVAALGYTVRPTAQAFEIGEIPGRLLALWSKRSRAIEAALVRSESSRDLASAAQKQYLTLLTRPAKTASSWEHIAGRWREEYGRIQPAHVPVTPWRAPRAESSIPSRDLTGLVGETVRALGLEYGAFRRVEVYGRLFSKAVGRTDAASLRKRLPALLEGMVVSVPAPTVSGRHYCFGNDWYECPTMRPMQERTPGPHPVLYLCWGSSRHLLSQLGSLGPMQKSSPGRPELLRKPWVLLGRPSSGLEASGVPACLFYLPRGMPLSLLDAARRWVGEQGMRLVLVEWPRREYGQLRLRGLDYLRRCGEKVSWLRNEDRDAFVAGHDWQPVPGHELERIIGFHAMREKGRLACKVDHPPPNPRSLDRL